MDDSCVRPCAQPNGARRRCGARYAAAIALLARIVLAVLILLVIGAAAAEAQPSETPVTVMTRNIYLGGNIFAPALAPNLDEFKRLAGGLWREVQSTDFPTRARLLAREVQRTDPDLIGLQEVALWRRGPGGVTDGAATPARQVVYDFLRIYGRALRRLGLRYGVAAKQREADIEASIDENYDVRLTIHDVILVKQRRELRIARRLSDNYEAATVVQTPGGAITITRGWVAVDANLAGKRFRFVDTHLENAGDAVREAQARELIGRSGPLRVLRRPLILVGDMNSDPNGRETPAGAFNVLRSFDLVDVWPTIRPRDPGFACCLEQPTIRDPTAQGFDHRIDLILTKPRLRGIRARVVGTRLSDRAPGGLWPSDHGGVVATLRLP